MPKKRCLIHSILIYKENRSLALEINNLKADLDNRNSDIGNLHELIEKIQEDKTKLTRKISKLLDNGKTYYFFKAELNDQMINWFLWLERELVQELDNLKAAGRRSTSNTSRVNGSNNNNPKSLTAKLDSHIKNIENERDFFKQEVDTLQKLLKAAQYDCKQICNTSRLNESRSSSNVRLSSSTHRSRKEAIKSPSRNKSSSPTSGVNNNNQRCYICAGNLHKPSTSTSPLRNTDEVRQLRRERDELQGLLDKFERHMTEVGLPFISSNVDRTICKLVCI